MRYPTALSLVIAALCASGAVGAGDIYCNNQGRDCSDRPSPNATVVHIQNPPSSASTDSAPPDTSAKTPTDASADARLKDNATRQAVQKDVAATRAEQCKQAQDKYQKAIAARRVYRLNKAGEREYLSDAEMEQARVSARLEVDRTCGSPAS
ncbi:MAG TPA: hypothetical protein VGN77_04455 [Steroidobacteraceae bacterium]|nr:hypothetical protein [Steroidobacteraceae bacterium]